MSQYYETGHRTFLPDATYPRGTRVKPAAGTNNGVTVAGATDVDIGTVFEGTLPNLPEMYGTQFPFPPVDVHLCTAQGTQQMIAAGTIAYGALVYPAANGQVGSTVSGSAVGTCLSAATAAGDLIEVLRLNH